MLVRVLAHALTLYDRVIGYGTVQVPVPRYQVVNQEIDS